MACLAHSAFCIAMEDGRVGVVVAVRFASSGWASGRAVSHQLDNLLLALSYSLE